MNIEYRDKKQSRKLIKIMFSAYEMKRIFDRVYKNMAADVNIAGFRPGKAPRKMIIETIGTQKLANMAIQEALREGYLEAIRKKSISPLGNPSIKVNKQPSFIEGDKDGLEFELEVDVIPEVTFTKDYTRIKLPHSKEDAVVTKKELDIAMEVLAQRKADLRPVKRGAKFGDKVEITFQGYERHVALEKLASKNHPLILGSKTLIPGFEEEIVGLKKGEKKEFKIQFPKNYHAKDVAGKKYLFKVTVDNVEEIIIPKINEEFAKSLGAKSLVNLRSLIKKNLEIEKRNRDFQALEDALVRELAKIARAELPRTLVTAEERRLRKLVEEVAQNQGISFEQYLKNIETTSEKFSADIVRQAATNVLIGLSLRAIAQKEKIKLSENDSLKKVVTWLIDKVKK